LQQQGLFMNRIKRYLTMGRMAKCFWQKKEILPYMPFRLWIESTNYCNLSCVMCLNKSKEIEKRGYMDYPLFKKIIDESKAFVHSVNLHHRGEPLMHEDLPKMIEYCRMHRIYTQLHTNATLLTQRKSHEIIMSGLDFISFSIDGYDKKSYERIRVGACYEQTVENIRGFFEIKKNLKKKRPQVAIELIDFFDEKKLENHMGWNALKRIGPVKWIIKKPHNWAGGIGSDRIRTISTKKSVCTFPWYSLTVLWDGTVVTCPQDFFGENVVGDVSRQSLKAIWNDSKMMDYRNRMKNGMYSYFRTCSSCDRLERRHFLGIPGSHLKGFFKESL